MKLGASVHFLFAFQICVYPTAAILVFPTASYSLPLGTGLSLGISTLGCQVISHTYFVPALSCYFIRYTYYIGALYMQHTWQSIGQKPYCCQSHLYPVHQCTGTIIELLLDMYDSGDGLSNGLCLNLSIKKFYQNI